MDVALRLAAVAVTLCGCGGRAEHVPPCEASKVGALAEFARAAAEVDTRATQVQAGVAGACRAIAADLGETLDPTGNVFDRCQRARQRVDATGLVVKITWTPFPCETPVPDPECIARCRPGVACESACVLLAAARVKCSAPAVEVQISGSSPQLAVVRATLERNLPALFTIFSGWWLDVTQRMISVSGDITASGKLDLAGVECLAWSGDGFVKLSARMTETQGAASVFRM